ncbi:hypothetical protein COCMIDRAFT_31201 [Bipolaris oryzae ATCC 44560]|uniref:Uncharacterized protein n=1 Tax=Bipolaris oryzae ATCC 44560 TaxID=930090 RepID=W6YVZ5_COCMI|nr:uncharacterized protein COCMIDRAFT_31201 [Bipolaris oryzae ATCC 44560]EUC39699.1 hypothetical protein COCMIDRAFT_31201 [Bipolaris oryzae ATCC 44560]
MIRDKNNTFKCSHWSVQAQRIPTGNKRAGGLARFIDDVMKSRVRYRTISIWIPINCAVKDHPLVLTNLRTVTDTDLVPAEQVYPCYMGEVFAGRGNTGQRFWYCNGMDSTEVVLFQALNSGGELDENGRLHSARRTHASFCVD